MILPLSICYIWTVGIRDFVLTRRLIGSSGLGVEVNPFAKLAVEQFGMESLLVLKLAGLGLYTLCIVIINRRNKHTSHVMAGVGSGVSVALSFWWDLVLGALSEGARGA